MCSVKKENCQALNKAEEYEKKQIKEEAVAQAAKIFWLAMPVLTEPEPELGKEKSKMRIEGMPEEDVQNPFLLNGPRSGDFIHQIHYTILICSCIIR
jgi:hypothetical protein